MARALGTETFRCFLGIALPQSVRDGLAQFAAALRDAGVRGSWVRSENYHLTIRFLGNLTASQLERIDAELPPVLASCPMATLRVRGAGAFPSVRRPRVLWAGLCVDSGDLGGIFAGAERTVRTLGLAAERHPAVPHITIARVRDAAGARELEKALAAIAAPASDAFEARSVALWKSTLHRSGAVYEQLREYPLSCCR